MVENQDVVEEFFLEGKKIVNSQLKRAQWSWQMSARGIKLFDLAAIDILFIQSAS